MARLVRRDYRPRPASFTDLPFVADVKVSRRNKRRSFWNVPQTNDYGEACAMGRQFACDMVQYFKDNPCWSGSNVLGSLVKDMAAYRCGTAMHGYEVGFWSALEVLLCRAASLENHWEVIQGVQDRYDAIAKANAAEGSTERAAA